MTVTPETLRPLPQATGAPSPARVLVANRGEIALRIIRSIRETGRDSVAVYADQDLDAQFVRAADHAYALDGTTAADTYLDGDKVLRIALASSADAIHPGYGFLAENADFAAKVRDAGIAWVGPSPEAINTLGDKVRARQTAVNVGVPPVPGTLDAITERAEVEEFIGRHGFPVVLKAADGGGGRGIHVMRSGADLDHFFLGRDITNGGAGYFVERYVPKARHIETQCGRDSHGNFTVYSSRDCSVQRRHQKMIEEAPAPFLTDRVRRALEDNSRALFEGVDYVGLGTCEYLLSEDGDLYFLEVNPRLQVEHTVTEEVAGVDLVSAQLDIAAGEPIGTDNPVRGHSIELRVTSEDPAADLFPTTGVLTRVVWPTGPGIRIDTGIGEGDQVSPEFDSMVAKIIVTAPTREQAIQRALRVTEETLLEGVSNPLSLYAHILRRSEFAGPSGSGGLGIWTRWLEDGVLDDFAAELAQMKARQKADGRADAQAPSSSSPAANGNPAAKPGRSKFIIELDGKRSVLTIPDDLLATSVASSVAEGKALSPQPLRSARRDKLAEAAAADGPTITSPMQAIVVRLVAEVGDNLAEGDLVMVLESMKMEKYVHAPRAGVLESVAVEAGQNVSPGQVLATLGPIDSPTTEGGAA